MVGTREMKIEFKRGPCHGVDTILQYIKNKSNNSYLNVYTLFILFDLRKDMYTVM